MASASTVKAVPWRLVLEVGTVVVHRFQDDIPPAERRRLAELVKKSKGDPRRLTKNERKQLLTLLRSVDAVRLGRDVSAIVGANKLRRRIGR